MWGFLAVWAIFVILIIRDLRSKQIPFGQTILVGIVYSILVFVIGTAILLACAWLWTQLLPSGKLLDWVTYLSALGMLFSVRKHLERVQDWLITKLT